MTGSTWKRALTTAVLASACHGCGFFIQMTTTNGPGGVLFNAKVTNTSQCPMAPPGLLVLPFFSAFQIPGIDPVDAASLQSLLSGVCNGQLPGQAPGIVDCHIDGMTLVCNFGAGDRSSATGGQPDTSGTGLTCVPDGGRTKCTVPLSSLPHFAAHSGGSSTDVMASCMTDGSATICLVPPEAMSTLPTGGMATTQFTLPKPPGSPNQSFAFPFPLSTGVCKSGTPSAGQPCGGIINTTDCGNMTTSDCGSGICQGGTNDTFGCDTDMDCPGMNATCVSCFGSAQSQLSLACATLPTHGTPTLSSTGLMLAAGLLLAVGVLGLRWRMRTS